MGALVSRITVLCMVMVFFLFGGAFAAKEEGGVRELTEANYRGTIAAADHCVVLYVFDAAVVRSNQLTAIHAAADAFLQAVQTARTEGQLPKDLLLFKVNVGTFGTQDEVAVIVKDDIKENAFPSIVGYKKGVPLVRINKGIAETKEEVQADLKKLKDGLQPAR